MTDTIVANARRCAKDKSTRVVTAGEIFPDGTVIELVSGSSYKPDLLLWDGTEATVAPQFEYGGCTYEAPDVAPSIYRAIRLPARCTDYDSIRRLFTGIVDLFMRNLHFPERESRLLAAFCVSTWLADQLPIAPGLAIYGLDRGSGIQVLQLLSCVCRRPLTLGEVTQAGFRSLPMHLSLTLLINQPGLTPKMQRLLQASNYRGLHFPGHRGSIVDLYGPKAIFWGTEAAIDNCNDGMIQILMAPSELQWSTLDEQLQREIATDFQPRLLMYRLKNHATVRECRVDVAEFTSATRQLARTLAACLPEDSELARDTVLLLHEQDQEARAQCSRDANCAIVEILWGLIHDRKQRAVKVEDLRKDVNALIRSRGEMLQYSAEEVGWKLRALGIPRHTISSGRLVLFNRDTSRRVHQLALAHDLPCLRQGHKDCTDCAEPHIPLSA